jgi:hypothetical protein
MSTAQKPAIDEFGLMRDFGEFLGRILVGPSARDAEAVWRDRVTSWRTKNGYLFQDKYEEFVRDRRLEGKTVPAPLSLAFPILENAVLEDDESLQEMWANLLVTVTDPARQAEVKRSFIHLIKQLDSIDAAVLNLLYRTYAGKLAQGNPDRSAKSDGLFHPRNAAILASTAQKTLGVSAMTVELALENLGRLRLTDTLADLLGQQVSLSMLGLKLMEACGVRPSSAP